jgi:cytochrome c-type biogenesis protein CcmH
MRLRIAIPLVLFVLAMAMPSALAIQPGEMLSNPILEQRARAIDKQLRCLVCQNQDIDDSDADLAHDLRLLVRERVVKGDTDDQVKQFIVARYGNYVLLKPPFDPETYLLWFAPAVLLVGALAVAIDFYRRIAVSPAKPLSPEEAERVAVLMGDGERG